MLKCTISLFAMCLSAGALLAQAPLQADEKAAKSYMELLRTDLRKERMKVVGDGMSLTAAEAAKFWPIYEKYEGELIGVNDQMLATIKKYADNYEKMSDAVADSLVKEVSGQDSQRAGLRQKYYAQVKAALGARVAARFVQVESLLDAIRRLQIGSSIPLIN